MSITEQQIRQHLRTSPVPGEVNTAQILANGHQQLRVRRRRRAVAASVPAVLAVALGGFALNRGDEPGYELIGSGLTLASGSDGPVQVDDDRVDLGNGVEAWREGKVVSVGFPEGGHIWLDITDPTAQWGDLDYDAAVLDAEGEDDGVTTVVGAVRGAPEHVEVSIAGVSQTATIACFTQAEGWCSYAAAVPFSIESYATQPVTVRVS